MESGFASSVMMAANAGSLAASRHAVVLPIHSPAIERTASLFQSDQFPLTPAAASLREVVLQVVHDLVGQDRWTGAELA